MSMLNFPYGLTWVQNRGLRPRRSSSVSLVAHAAARRDVGAARLEDQRGRIELDSELGPDRYEFRDPPG
jgi:hypothetical protein